MSQNGIKINILWVKQIQWQFGNLLKTYFWIKPARSTFLSCESVFWIWADGNTFSELENVFSKSTRTAGLIFKKQGVSFAKVTAEGVSFIWGRWIAGEWPRLNRGEGRGLAGRSWKGPRRRHGRWWPELLNRATRSARKWTKRAGAFRSLVRTHRWPRLEPRTSDSSPRRQTADGEPLQGSARVSYA